MNKQKLIVLYDSWCPVCSRTKSILGKIDWLKKMNYKSIRDPITLEKYHLVPERVEKRMHTIWGNQEKIEDGIYSIVRISKQIPLLWTLLPFLQVVIFVGFGQKVYDWLASRRKILPIGSCSEETCELQKK